MPTADVATAAGFYDQSHLTRHFKRFLATTPARFAASGRSEVPL
jgi:transcriptional regulator GlxA family with amidase domain